MSEKLFRARLERLNSMVTTEEAKQALATVSENWDRNKYVHEILLNTASSGRQRGSVEMLPEMRALVSQSLSTEKSITTALDSLAELIQIEAERSYVSMGKQFEATRTQMLVVMSLVLAVTLVVAVLLTETIRRGLSRIEVAARVLAEGNVEHDLQSRKAGRDEVGQTILAFGQVVEYMREMASVAGEVSRGDLSREVVPRSPKDALGTAFAQMVTSLRSMVKGVSAAADGLAEASQMLTDSAGQAGSATQQIAATIQQVAQGNQEQSVAVQETASSADQLARAIEQIVRGTEEQARSIDKASVSVTQLNQSISQASTASKEVSGATHHVETAASTGATVVQETIRGMATIRDKTNSAAAEVQDLMKYSEQIGSIVEAIDDIAEQTNLLALNAAIEAARAGEHGRGFAVVADEVRKLAERSSRSTKEIASLIAGLRREIGEAVTAMELGLKDVEAGSVLAEEADRALQSITQSVKVAADQVNRIAAAVQSMESSSDQVVEQMHDVSMVVEQSSNATTRMNDSSEQVGTAMERIASVSEQTSAAAQEVSASAEEVSAQVTEMVTQSRDLAKMAEGLKSMVARFNLGSSSEVVLRRRKDDWAGQPPEAPSGNRGILCPM